jgi:glycosyltransferase involved in cell wall biosynthesis
MYSKTSSVSKSENRPLIVFGEDWGMHPSSTQHIIKILGKTRTIIWLNSIGLRKPKLTFHDLFRTFKKIKSFIFNQRESRNITKDGNYQFIIINPLVMPCANSWLSLTLSKIILRLQVRLAARKTSLKDPIIWTSLPTSVDYLKIFKGAPCVYYCGDDFSSLAGVDHNFVAQKESALIKKSSYIFTASEKLDDKFPQDKVINIPHGVNFSMFSDRIYISPGDQPQGKPIAGFYGSISTWLDQALLVKTIAALPDWNFVLIGKIECNVDKLSRFSNVYFLGTKPHHQLPQYIQSWNVAMLPFVDNKQIQMCNPLKLREYLASGTPIVTTDFSALNGYRKYIQIANEYNPFYQAILLANAEITPLINFNQLNNIDDVLKITKGRALRKACVSKESWESRARDIQHYLFMC